MTIQCDQCNLMMINKVLCHETGCPDSWKFIKRSCKWCGQEFEPQDIAQDHCEMSCYYDYHGIEYESVER